MTLFTESGPDGLRCSKYYAKAMQILIGVFQIGLGGILAYLTEHLGFNRVLTGLPFCSGLVFIVSGALTIAADLTGFLILMRSSLGMSTVGIISAAAAIVGLSIDLFLVYGEHSTRHECESRGQQMIDDGLSKCLFAILYVGGPLYWICTINKLVLIIGGDLQMDLHL
uniref:Membrane-spanning 4-domains subfamily A member 6B-like n=1 Tax=Geotrypetes seraphini TaxID=260995 RepID=A0A6P8PJE3_GEOSA|nr:membrane-spanning 4-domains subfamily A member 6B-like [Geotrypetes seraphini]